MSKPAGKQVPTTGYVREQRNGVPQAVPVPGLAFIPDPLPPAIEESAFGRLLVPVHAASAALYRLESLLRSLPDPQLLLTPMRRREVQFSSKIEDTHAAAAEVVMAELGPAAREEVAEVRNNLVALDLGASSPLPLSLRLIREMHAALMSGVRGGNKTPGEFRTTQVFIGGDGPDAFRRARFVPPPPGEHLSECLESLEKYLNPGPGRERRQDVLPLELAMAHYQFEAIHPFSDGNGRLGRLLVSLLGFKSGQLAFPMPYISNYLEANRQQYYDRLLAVSRDGDWEGWLAFFCHAVESACLDDIDRATRLQSLRESYRARVQSAGSSAKGLQLVDILFKKPAVSAASASRLLDATIATAQKHVSALERAGILKEITGSNYGRIWVAQEVLDIIDD